MEYLIEIVGAAVLGLGSWVLMWLKENLKSSIINKLMPEFESMLEKAVRYGERKAKEASKDGVTHDNDVIKVAVQFVFDNAPKLLKRLGIKKEAVRSYVESKMEELT
jgi:hypothetical protein